MRAVHSAAYSGVIATVNLVLNAFILDATSSHGQQFQQTEEQLAAVARTYVVDGLGEKNFDAIPYADDVSLRAPLGPNGSWTPFEGIESLRKHWWAPLPDLLGEVRLIDTHVNAKRNAVTAVFHLGLKTEPHVTLRIVDRFVVNSEGEIIEQENFFDPRDLTNPWREPASVATVFNWTSKGTFDASQLPACSAQNTFSNSSPFKLDQVKFDHTVEVNEDLSELRLFDGTFEITTASGDVLLGTYQDFVYRLQEDGTYWGTGDFLFDGGTGAFQNASGSGSWTVSASFTSPVSGTADHVWTGTLNVPVPEPCAACRIRRCPLVRLIRPTNANSLYGPRRSPSLSCHEQQVVANRRRLGS